MPPWLSEYEAITSHAGLVDCRARTLVELRGADRARFLHNFCTNDINRLAVGAGCEAFLANGQGKTLAHVYVFAQPDEIVVETVPDQAVKLIAHLDRYLIRENVQLIDRGAGRGQWLLAGAEATSVLAKVGCGEPPRPRLNSITATLAGHAVWLRHVDWIAADGFLIECDRAELDDVGAALLAAGAAPCGPAALDAARIEAGTPLFGRDISDKNLPQEVARDALAISFTKGCYLGQETVARIDALGHVNRVLVGVRFDSTEVPADESPLLQDGAEVGRITSAAYSPRLGAAIALASVRREHCAQGTTLTSSVGPGTVIELPVRELAARPGSLPPE